MKNIIFVVVFSCILVGCDKGYQKTPMVGQKRCFACNGYGKVNTGLFDLFVKDCAICNGTGLLVDMSPIQDPTREVHVAGLGWAGSTYEPMCYLTVKINSRNEIVSATIDDYNETYDVYETGMNWPRFKITSVLMNGNTFDIYFDIN